MEVRAFLDSISGGKTEATTDRELEKQLGCCRKSLRALLERGWS